MKQVLAEVAKREAKCKELWEQLGYTFEPTDPMVCAISMLIQCIVLTSLQPTNHEEFHKLLPDKAKQAAEDKKLEEQRGYVKTELSHGLVGAILMPIQDHQAVRRHIPLEGRSDGPTHREPSLRRRRTCMYAPQAFMDPNADNIHSIVWLLALGATPASSRETSPPS